MRFSIVINNYNYARFVGQAIESALAQTYSEVEILVVDDGSTDNSREVISSYSDRGVKTIFKANGGQGSAFNAGFAASSGDLVLFLDADDSLKPLAVETVVAKWRPEMSVIYFRLEMVRFDGQVGQFIPDLARKIPEGLLWPKIIEEGREPDFLPPTSGDVYTRAVLEECLPMPENIHHLGADAYLRPSAAFMGEVGAIQEALGYYRVHSINNSRDLYLNISRLRERMNWDLFNFRLLHRGAARHGKTLKVDPEKNDFDHLRLRMMSLREDPSSHTVKEDRRLKIWWWSLGALRHHPRPLWKKILQGLQMSFLMVLPSFMVKRLNRLWSKVKIRIS